MSSLFVPALFVAERPREKAALLRCTFVASVARVVGVEQSRRPRDGLGFFQFVCRVMRNGRNHCIEQFACHGLVAGLLPFGPRARCFSAWVVRGRGREKESWNGFTTVVDPPAARHHKCVGVTTTQNARTIGTFLFAGFERAEPNDEIGRIEPIGHGGYRRASGAFAQTWHEQKLTDTPQWRRTITCGRYRARTDDLHGVNVALCQLS